MARIRTIKPDFFRSDDVAGLSYRARLTWIGLWTYVDDEGRGKDNARIIKGDLWPLEDDVTHKDVEADLQELDEANRIIRYVADGERCLLVRKWNSHQRISKPSPSKLPGPPSKDSGDSATIPGGVPEDSATTTGGLPLGKEGNREVEEGSGREEAFAQFWSIYPRKDDKAVAKKKFPAALKKASLDEILTGAEQYREDPNREPSFTKLAATWLNAEAWDNGPLPPRNQEVSASDRRFQQDLQLVQSMTPSEYGQVFEIGGAHGTA